MDRVNRDTIITKPKLPAGEKEQTQMASAYNQELIDKFSDGLKDAVSKGLVKYKEVTGKIGAKASPSNKEEEFSALEFDTDSMNGAMALTDGKLDKVLSGFLASYNNLLKQNARNAKITEMEESDPDFAIQKAIRKIANTLIAADIDEDTAWERAKAAFGR